MKIRVKTFGEKKYAEAAHGFDIPPNREFQPKTIHAQLDVVFVVFDKRTEAEGRQIFEQPVNLPGIE